jgi:hypothetical protein
VLVALVLHPKETTVKKLKLSKDTIRNLQDTDLAAVAGGADGGTPTPPTPPSMPETRASCTQCGPCLSFGGGGLGSTILINPPIFNPPWIIPRF